MTRYAAGVEYDGSTFHGWQRVPKIRNVQQTVEDALSQIASHPVSVICAGRTDAGVHALGQVIHFDSDAQRDPRAWLFGTNAKLPHDVSIRWVNPVTDDFHARFSATARSYRYVVFNHRQRSAILRNRVTEFHQALDIDLMREAAQFFVGTQDFSSFRASACQAKSPVRTMHHLTIERQGAMIYFDLRANAFLHHMVRNLVGVMLTIGAGEKPPQWAKEVLDQRDRRVGGITAKPHGLYFVNAEYPAEFDLPPAPLPPVFAWASDTR